MNGAVLLLVGTVCFGLAYAIYGRYLSRLFGVDPRRSTPAHTHRDGVDYLPTRLPVLFGHHFASIAGAGPIVGPVLAAYLGWGPVALWIIFGCIFIGGMHDFASLFLSIRHGGRSIGKVIEAQLGYSGRQIFLLFSWAALILVVAIFAIFVANTFVTQPAVATASLMFIAMAPIFGVLVGRLKVRLLPATLVFVPLLFLSIWVSTKMPLDLAAMLSTRLPPDLVAVGLAEVAAKHIWLVVLMIYAGVASVTPVWVLLQPRDYLNSFLLYAMIIAGFVGIVVAAPHFEMPAFMGWSAVNHKGGIAHLFPILYVTVACGACSGFHALVSSGTTAKQLDSERHMKPVGYGAMLVEGALALMALTSVAILTREQYVTGLGESSPVVLFSKWLATFTAQVGLKPEVGVTFFALSIAAFLLTTLDTATRLTRFVWQELFLPREGSGKSVGVVSKGLGHPILATGVVVLLSSYLAFSGTAWELWPVFGASNQLLAALTLLVVTLYLVRKKANFWIALVPMLFMSTITAWALVQLFQANRGENLVLVCATGFLLLMAGALGVMAVLSLRKVTKRKLRNE
jgi:carbon starvation protein